MTARALVPEYAHQARRRLPGPCRPAPVALVTPALAAELAVQDPEDDVLRVLRRKPATVAQLTILTGLTRSAVERAVDRHDAAGRIRVVERVQTGRGGNLTAVWAANW